MKQKLFKKFYQDFIGCLIIGLFVLSLFTVLTIKAWTGMMEIGWAIIASMILIMLLVFVIKTLLPFIKDYKYVKKNIASTIVGYVTRYKEKEMGGDPPTTYYIPIVKEINSDMEIELSVRQSNIDSIQLNKPYRILYLPHTKITMFSEELDDNL